VKYLFAAMGLPVDIDDLLDPPPEWMARQIDQAHVQAIAAHFIKNPLFHLNSRQWIVIVDVSKKEFGQTRSIDTYPKFLIAGRHRKEALLNV